ncbi:ankyrin repeat domain-containing protein [Rubricoccus marinus]|uniref:Uncharacterized protein n=1 Tax=Rubricoccus marinus TaxID=716817 RepID=A0A259U171_9BACT|nr:ankyrin repeat domain-containing protein [Rubricoccus marinus]OZC03749.1 hypothetical protein BSZ36_12605 [Rubricoccus marinus]
MRLLALSVLLLAAGPASAQGPCAEVRILAYAGSAPSYDGTLVELFTAADWNEGKPARYSAQTDARGEAVFTSLTVTDYVAVVSRRGFEPAEGRFMCLSASRTRLNFALAPEASGAAAGASGDCPPLPRAETAAHVRCALDAGADPNETDAEGWAPLHAAINRSDAEAIRLLVDAGADLSVAGPYGRPILHHAVIYADADAATIRLLVEAGADPATADDNGDTALHAAARFDAAGPARALLDAGADPDARSADESRHTPMHAAFLGSVKGSVVPILLQYGADPTIHNADGLTPLDLARLNDDSEYTDFSAAVAALQAALGE